MTTPEFSRPVDRRQIVARPVVLKASEAERAALAKRFGLIAVKRLEAKVSLAADGEAIDARGRLSGAIVQSCAVSGADLPTAIDEPIALRFVPETPPTEDEIELQVREGEPDEIPFAGDLFDLGEAVAQTLALAIDPYAVGPEADKARKDAGITDEAASGPFAALAALKKDG